PFPTAPAVTPKALPAFRGGDRPGPGETRLPRAGSEGMACRPLRLTVWGIGRYDDRPRRRPGNTGRAWAVSLTPPPPFGSIPAHGDAPPSAPPLRSSPALVIVIIDGLGP